MKLERLLELANKGNITAYFDNDTIYFCETIDGIPYNHDVETDERFPKFHPDILLEEILSLHGMKIERV
jgi:hypothetical protein